MKGQDAPPFMPGLTLGKRFYLDIVRPLLAQRFPGLAYSAALLGAGSEVFGYDTPMSTDHDWGPRVLIFLPEGEASLEGDVGAFLREAVPDTYAGFPVPPPGLPDSDRDVPARTYLGPLRRYVRQALGHDPIEPLEAADWLAIPSQSLREMTAGEVFHDGLGTLEPLRRRLAYYPRDVWLYLLASGWQRLGQDEHLMPRAGQVGDELGSSLIGARLVQGVMHLGFLMERRYAPYSKWFGRAFGELACAGVLGPLLWRAQQAAAWQERETAFVAAGEHLGRMHNGLGITPPLAADARPFHDRPFRVIDGGRFARAVCAEIRDPAVRAIAARGLIGGIDQWSDSTDLKAPAWRQALRGLYAV